jgi:uncharacterized NAD(P)/FAD-binding protein YdhS
VFKTQARLSEPATQTTVYAPQEGKATSRRLIVPHDDARKDATQEAQKQEAQTQIDSRRRWRTAIVGGGFSGAAVAYRLARAGVETLVFEPRARLGGGLAYGGDDPAHRVNVPASRMSLLPEDEGQFTRWLAQTGALGGDPAALVGAEAYPQRGLFGRYVEAQLQPLVAAGAVRHIGAAVAQLRRTPGGWQLVTEAGEAFEAGLAVIATTHPAPALPAALAALSGDARLICDPFAAQALAPVGADERVLILGAGLTAADIVAGFDARGHRGPITMISRRALRSRSHPPASAPAEGDFAGDRTATALLARVRAALAAAQAGGRSWHGVVEALRLQGGDIWRTLAPDARRRVVRHLRPYWDAHRFRLAPQLDALLAAKLADGSLILRKGRLAAAAQGPALCVEIDGAAETFDRIILATGPASDILGSQPFLRGLAAAGALTPDPSGLGLATSTRGRAIGADGAPDPTLFIAGPLARGAFGELMGLPNVAIYARFIADEIAAALGA